MTDDEIALWLITKGTMEDKPTMALAADRILTLRAEMLAAKVEMRRLADGLPWAFIMAAYRDRDALKAVTAERDGLKEALQQFPIEYDEVDLADAEPSSLTAAVLSVRAALKGETP